MRKLVSLFLSVVFALFSNLAHALDTGEQAPDFTGTSTQGPIKLSDFRGKKNVVLALYFAAFTPV